MRISVDCSLPARHPGPWLAAVALGICSCVRGPAPPVEAAAPPPTPSEDAAANRSQTSESTPPCPPARKVIVKVPAECPPAPPPADAPKARRAPDEICVFGQVNTAGGMVLGVQRAKVTVSVGSTALGATWTDANGRYVWCAPARAVKAGTQVTVRASKKPFNTETRSSPWTADSHLHVSFSMAAQGLTD